MIRTRGVFVSILLSLITCGIYSIFWMAALSNDISDYLGEERKGGIEVLLMFITCGLYMFFWNFKQGKRVADAQEKAGLRVSDNSVIYLIITFFSLAMVPTWVMQSDMNTIATKKYL